MGPRAVRSFTGSGLKMLNFSGSDASCCGKGKKSVRLIQQCPVFMGFWNQGKQEFMMACTSVVFSAVLIAK